ncbi:MAG: prepilin-type N-terminal cleavage/methylation domain-containing protein [Thermoanaerobaculia bacterium]|nr:prepilin-type N-terminal cleavage/methylation domain-containing protein [Thermoanaerobaculia bacterium]
MRRDRKAPAQRSTRGFTLLELLIVVAIVGIIAALIVPNLLEALNKSKQKRTMTDIRLTGTAWFSYITDQVGAASAGQPVSSTFDWTMFTTTSWTDLEDILVPVYAAYIPPRDAWGSGYQYGATDDINDLIPVGIRSRGADGVFSGDEYTPGAFLATDFVQDIVWAGGYFVRWPAGHLVQ